MLYEIDKFQGVFPYISHIAHIAWNLSVPQNIVMDMNNVMVVLKFASQFDSTLFDMLSSMPHNLSTRAQIPRLIKAITKKTKNWHIRERERERLSYSLIHPT